MPDPLPPICILAGGLGTRLGDRVQDTPKPLLEVAGAPFLIHQLRLLAEHGARRAVISVGYLGDLIEQRVGPEQFGITLHYSHDGATPLGTLGAIRKAAPQLGGRFLILYGDTYLQLDYAGVTRAWADSRLPAMMTVLRNQGRWDTSNATFDGRLVTRYDKRSPDPSMDWIDYGLGGLTAEVLELAAPAASELADLYHELAAAGHLFGYAATERFYEIGTPSALAETEEFLARSADQLSSDGPVPQGPAWHAIVLSWNRRDDTLRCLESLSNIGRADLGIICVDNGSIDGSVEAVRDRFPEVTLIEADENLGYAGGNNLGLRYALEHGAQRVVLVNNDATVAPDVIEGFEQAITRATCRGHPGWQGLLCRPAAGGLVCRSARQHPAGLLGAPAGLRTCRRRALCRRRGHRARGGSAHGDLPRRAGDGGAVR